MKHFVYIFVLLFSLNIHVLNPHQLSSHKICYLLYAQHNDPEISPLHDSYFDI